MSQNPEFITSYMTWMRKHHKDPAMQVGWHNRDIQYLRFLLLTGISDLTGCTVLDVGCGNGELLAYFNQQHIHADYSGIDILPEFIDDAKKRFPDASFKQANVLDDAVHEKVDFVLSSGAFNYIQEDQDAYIKAVIHKLFSLCHQGVAFNLTSSFAPEQPEKPLKLYYYEPTKILATCLELTQYVSLQQHYLDNDFTVYMFK